MFKGCYVGFGALPFIIKCVHGLERDVKAFVFRTVQMSSGCLATFVVYASRLELVIVLH